MPRRVKLAPEDFGPLRALHRMRARLDVPDPHTGRVSENPQRTRRRAELDRHIAARLAGIGNRPEFAGHTLTFDAASGELVVD